MAGKLIAAQLNAMAVKWFVPLSPGSPTAGNARNGIVCETIKDYA